MRFFLLLLIFTVFLFFPELNSAQENSSELSTELVETEKSEVSENKRVPLPLKADKFRKEFSFKIRRGTALRKDYDICKNGLEQLELPEHKQPFYLLLALYHRIIDREPVKALEILAPLVVPNDVAEKWVTEQREAAQREFEKWSKKFETAKQAKKKKDDIPKRPEGIFVEFPAMETWKLDDSTAAVGIEIAYLEPKLNAFVGTPSESRVVLGFANRLKIGENHNLLPQKMTVCSRIYISCLFC